MQILEQVAGPDQNQLGVVKSLARLISTSGRIPEFNWRDNGGNEYREYLARTPMETIVQEVTELLQGQVLGVSRAKFPQHLLEKLYPGFQQFTLWSLMGQLGLPEIKQILSQAFPAVARVTFRNDQPSVPAIWHAHTLVGLGSKPPLPANALVWTGSKLDQGKTHLSWE